MANKTLLDNLQFITDRALEDLSKGYTDPNLEQTFRNYINSGSISSAGQSYDATLYEAITYYKYIRGEVSLGSGGLADPLLNNMKILSDKAIADRKNGYEDPNIEDTIRSMVKSGFIIKNNGDEDLTVNESVAYYKYIKGNTPSTTNNTSNVTNNTSNTTSASNSNNTSTTNISNNSTSNNITNSSTSSISNTSITLKDAGVSDIIKAINSCTNDIDTVLNKITNNEINAINNSWVATETSSYVAKVNEAGNKMRKINQALNLLGTTFDKALKLSEETSKQVNNYVNNIK